MKRHPSLIPLSHDHHRALVEARRLRATADGPRAVAMADAFLRFFETETVRHFREEEELLFPTVVHVGEAHEPLARALMEHQRLHASALRLRHAISSGRSVHTCIHALADQLEQHVRFEERHLFPLIERLVDESALPELSLARGDSEAAIGPATDRVAGGEALASTLRCSRRGRQMGQSPDGCSRRRP